MGDTSLRNVLCLQQAMRLTFVWRPAHVQTTGYDKQPVSPCSERCVEDVQQLAPCTKRAGSAYVTWSCLANIPRGSGNA
eukprot:9482110-Lingulodinium_polyedra.AAC.1